MGQHALTISDAELEQLTQRAAKLATTYWSSLSERPAFPLTNGPQTFQHFTRSWDEAPRGSDVLQDFDIIAQHARPSVGGFFGYVAGSGEPVGALGDFLASALNQNVTAWRSAPSATVVERTVVKWLAESIGCGEFSGSLCGGGSAANLMGLAMAREAKLPANEEGVKGGVVYASEEVHMSIPKSIALLGLGTHNLRRIATDEQFRMRLDLLREAIAADRRAGLKPIAVVASAGAVSTGAIDLLEEIAAVAREENLWMHVDGAYGAAAALAVPERFHGLALADSLSLDAHKFLYQPIDCGCLLFKDARFARQAFSNNGDYVQVFSHDSVESFAFFDESMELSRRFRALKLWMSFQYHGRRAFREAILDDLLHAQELAEAIQKEPDLEVVAPIPLSAVCFRHRSKDNQTILRRVIERGRVFISNATINGQFVLRACFVNHLTTEADVKAIVSEVLAAAEVA
ncbi:pyridoxal phosphate-dependent decarboxylase [Trichoderma arundinaceum]|uniref:Pyridoxal phosphate-dependent decarboxylase n=1 Tax=Trichoderma arundinaceum TaxID=490622 RepID=A0A395NBW5_TRIAR|nr:pyridoxal phosphate-dependent decarboxylase [Trichoderma arundinaceum]